MEQQEQQSGKRIISTLGWIVGKTLVLTYRILVAGFKIGLELIVSNLTQRSRPQRTLPAARSDRAGTSYPAPNTI